MSNPTKPSTTTHHPHRPSFIIICTIQIQSCPFFTPTPTKFTISNLLSHYVYRFLVLNHVISNLLILGFISQPYTCPITVFCGGPRSRLPTVVTAFCGGVTANGGVLGNSTDRPYICMLTDKEASITPIYGNIRPFKACLKLPKTPSLDGKEFIARYPKRSTLGKSDFFFWYHFNYSCLILMAIYKMINKFLFL